MSFLSSRDKLSILPVLSAGKYHENLPNEEPLIRCHSSVFVCSY
jgi:hypothetical protein